MKFANNSNPLIKTFNLSTVDRSFKRSVIRGTLVAVGALIFVYVAVEHNKAVTYHECGPCHCKKESNPICVRGDQNSFTTYENACEWFCVARCLKPETKFVHCGRCGSRPIPTRSPNQKRPISQEDFKCLDFLDW